MSELEQAEATGEDRRAAAERAGDLLLVHAELLQLELYIARRRMFADPGVVSIKVGSGNPVEQTIQGNQQDPYNGAAIFNPTSATLSIGFQAGTALLAPMTLPPYSWACFSQRFVNLSIATLNAIDQASTIPLPVTVARLRLPPEPSAGPWGNPSTSPALAAANPGSLVAVSTAGSNAIVAANPARRELTITNGQAASWVTLQLGSVAGAIWAGVPLAPNGGVWQSSEHDGAVSAIAHTANTSLSVAEV